MMALAVLAGLLLGQTHPPILSLPSQTVTGQGANLELGGGTLGKADHVLAEAVFRLAAAEDAAATADNTPALLPAPARSPDGRAGPVFLSAASTHAGDGWRRQPGQTGPPRILS